MPDTSDKRWTKGEKNDILQDLYDLDQIGFCPITPESGVRFATRSRVHLVLAHLVGELKDYTAFYRERSQAGDYIYLDNGAFENGIPMSNRSIINAAEKVGADCLVAPDYPGEEPEKTYKAHMDFIEQLERVGLLDEYDVMGVPQTLGGDSREYTDLIKRMLDTEEINVIGISKLAVPNALKGLSNFNMSPEINRTTVAQAVVNLWPERLQETRIHFLGMFSQPWELDRLGDIRLGQSFAPWTCDSSLPYWTAYANVLPFASMEKTSGEKTLINYAGMPSNPISFDAPAPDEEQEAAISLNFELMREYLPVMIT